MIALHMTGPVETQRERYVLNGCRNTLDPGVASLTGCKMAEVHWMEKFGDWKHAECAANWSSPTSAARWDFRAVEPGAFYLDIEYTCPAEDDYSEWQVTCDNRTVTFPLIDTGERDHRAAFGGALPRFRTYRVGLLNLPEPGAHTLPLSPTGPEGAGIRISALILTPLG